MFYEYYVAKVTIKLQVCKDNIMRKLSCLDWLMCIIKLDSWINKHFTTN